MFRMALVLTVCTGVVLSVASCRVHRERSQMADWQESRGDAEVFTGAFDLAVPCQPFVTGTGRRLLLRKMPPWVEEILSADPGRAFRVVARPYRGTHVGICPGLSWYEVLEMRAL